jgi:hypothetical protein
VTALMNPGEIADCFDATNHLTNLDQIYQRLGI